MADRPAPVTDLAWSPEQARELGAGVLDLWAELLERLPDELVTRERAPADTAAALALPVPEEPMATAPGVVDLERRLPHPDLG